jgi:hypothetical protein
MEILCTVEKKSNLKWVLEQIKKMLPIDFEIITYQTIGEEIEIYCKQKLTKEQRMSFEKSFDDYDFTDIAWLCY